MRTPKNLASIATAPARRTRVLGLLAALAALLVVVIFAGEASAASGKFSLKSKEVNEGSGAWRVYVTIELPKPPLTAHQSMKFLFTKTAVYERSLVDGKPDPVMNRQTLDNQTPTVESLDVDFADASGKVFSKTIFDFGLTRVRGYEAGEYKVELRTSEGYTVGSTSSLTLKGDNPPVDRRAMSFNAKEKSIKKVDAYDAGANQAKNDDSPTGNNMGPGEVTPTGTATGFVPKEGMQETEEEKIKTKPGGCGCEIPGRGGPLSAAFFFLPVLGIGLVAVRRRGRDAARRASRAARKGA